ncbi:hypothetical protein [Devosia sp.]|uniref:hypothetical protein n=1 Tax=Devosia sp. TaxID=1871048 RepID=UPI003BAD027C
MPELLIHCGLHKTGTTALQNFLFANVEVLAGLGISYPRAGIPAAYGLTGHHNLAWWLGRDRRYMSDVGEFDALFKEIDGFTGRTVLLSSEDFENSLLHPARWTGVAARAASLGFSVRFLVYTRNVTDHLESVFLQKLRSGFGDEFSQVARTVVETGNLRSKEWQACFDARAIAKSLAQVPGTELSFRDYESLVGGSTIADFCAFMGLDHVTWQAPMDARVNPRNPIETSLVLFLLNRDGTLSQRQSEVDAFVRAQFAGKAARLVTPPRLRQVMEERLMGKASAPRASAAGDLNIARVFSFETQVMFRESFAIAHSDAPPQQRSRQVAARMAQWWAWAADTA